MDKELNPKKPDEIEFNEKMDEPINGDEMNNMLESLLKSRNIIEVKREENKEENVPKIKISNIEELLDENLIIDINNSNNNSNNNSDNNSNIVLDKEYENNLDENNLGENELYKNSEFIKIKNFNKILNEEYKDENNYNLNYKLNSINKMLKDLLNNQNLIMKKLNILEEKEKEKEKEEREEEREEENSL